MVGFTKRQKPMGRPTLYKPEYCQQVEEYMSQGYSLTAAAGYIGHYADLLYDWIEKHDDFRQAVKRGQAARVMKLEGELLRFGGNKDAPKVVARIFALKNAAPNEWKDKHEVTNNVVVTEVKMKIVKPKQ